jgi:hypothetical protein
MNSTTTCLEHRLPARKDLVPGSSNPFYIIAPPYTHQSFDVETIHSLCHYLNVLGEDAYLLPYPLELRSDPCWPYFCGFPVREWRNARLHIRILTQEVVDLHFSRRLTPICVATDGCDVPFPAPFIARYILRAPDPTAPQPNGRRQFTFAYSQGIAEGVGTAHVLQIPPVDADLTEFAGAQTAASMVRLVMDDLYAQLPQTILEFARTVKEECKRVPYDAKIVLPYVCKTVFVSADPMVENGTREEIACGEERREVVASVSSLPAPAEPVEHPIHAVATRPGLVLATKRRIRHFLADWLLPPRIKQIAQRLWGQIRNAESWFANTRVQKS